MLSNLQPHFENLFMNKKIQLTSIQKRMYYTGYYLRNYMYYSLLLQYYKKHTNYYLKYCLVSTKYIKKDLLSCSSSSYLWLLA